jgi:hypothetical protein
MIAHPLTTAEDISILFTTIREQILAQVSI